MNDERPKQALIPARQALVQARYYAWQAERMVRAVEPTAADVALVSQAFSALAQAELAQVQDDRVYNPPEAGDAS